MTAGFVSKRWARAALGGALFGAITIGFAPAEHQLTVSLAVLNVLVGSGIVASTWGRGTLRFAVLAAILPGIVVSWPLTSIYLALFFPEAMYLNQRGEFPLLRDGYRLQVAVTVFLVAYAVAVWPTAKWRPRGGENERSLAGPLAPEEWPLTLAAIAAVTGGWLAPMLDAPDAVQFVANGARNYLGALFFATGLRWHAYSTQRKWIVLGALTVSAFVNTIANSRGFAVLPFLMLGGGALMARETTSRTRWIVTAMAVAALPVYAVVGNQTRLALGTIGLGNFEGRASVLASALQGDLRMEHGGYVHDTAVRMFGTGGHALIQTHWDEPWLERFDLERYVSELGAAVMPAFLFGRVEGAQYSGTSILRDYGFFITENTSVEVSLVGSLFLAAGLPGVACGALLIGLLNCAVVRMLNQGRYSVLKVVLAAGLVFVNLNAFNLDLIQDVRAGWWMAFYQTIVVTAVRLFTRLRPVVGVRDLA